MVDFIQQEVAIGIQHLYVLRLQGAPPEDGIALTAKVWIGALKKKYKTWNEEDKGRISKGFDSLILEVTRWPSPAMLIEHIPPRPEKLQIGYKPKFTQEELERNKQNIRNLSNTLARKKGLDHDQT